jgi:hypothetical protein
MHEGIYGITALTLKNREERTGYLAFWKAHFRSGGPKLRILDMKLVEDFPELLRWRNPKFKNSVEEHRRNSQARLNLDKARQKTPVMKYANYFREQLLELPHRHEPDNVHDFQRGLRPSTHKEVALKALRPYTRRFKRPCERRQRRPRLRQPNARHAD